MLERVTRGCKEFVGVTGVYKGLERVTRSYKV